MPAMHLVSSKRSSECSHYETGIGNCPGFEGNSFDAASEFRFSAAVVLEDGKWFNDGFCMGQSPELPAICTRDAEPE
jgi:hypothetical protein